MCSAGSRPDCAGFNPHSGGNQQEDLDSYKLRHILLLEWAGSQPEFFAKALSSAPLSASVKQTQAKAVARGTSAKPEPWGRSFSGRERS